MLLLNIAIALNIDSFAVALEAGIAFNLCILMSTYVMRKIMDLPGGKTFYHRVLIYVAPTSSGIILPSMYGDFPTGRLKRYSRVAKTHIMCVFQ